jgi:hypothetical protein
MSDNDHYYDLVGKLMPVTLPTNKEHSPMSQHNSFPLFVKHNLQIRPQDFIVTDATCAEVEQRAKEMRVARDAANPPKVEPAGVELNRLRKELFDLQQWAKYAEIHCNNVAGTVKGLEQRLTEVLKHKKIASDAGNLLAERNYEHSASLLESELVDAKEEFTRAKKQSSNNARALREFDGQARIAELKKELGL